MHIDARTRNHVVATAATALGLAIAGCGEIPQDGPKPFVGAEETKSYAGAMFNGDKALYERTLAQRADTQNEYLATGAAQAAGRTLDRQVLAPQAGVLQDRAR